MKFASKDGQFLELRILGYEFPHIETAEYASNWLIVAGNVTNSRGSWQFTHPCLLTYEAERLASWMVALVEIDRFPTTCGFIEPNLEFRALLNMNRPMLRVYFDLEARPLWASSASGEEVTWVEFPIEELDLRSTARQWHAELSVYPQRASQ
jgi:hypothetical protein